MGDTRISGALLELPEWDLTLNGISGAFRFTEGSIAAQNLQGQLFHEPVTLSLETSQEKNKSHSIIATLQGNLQLAVLQSWLKIPFDKVATGTTDYQAKLHLPSHDDDQPIQIMIQSDLKGITLNLPDTFGKTAAEARDFEFDLTVKQPLLARFKYANLLTAALSLEKTNQGMHLHGGEIHLGATGEAAWQKQPGILVSGQLNELDWNRLQPYFANNNQSGAQTDNLNLLRAVNVRVNKVNAFGLTLKDLQISVTKESSGLAVGLDNADFSGKIRLPRRAGPISAEFERFYFSSSTHPTESIDPKNLPAISFVGNDVRFNDKKLGRIELNVVPASSGLTIKQLNMETPNVTLHATGDWLQKKTQSSSHLQGEITTDNVSKMLTAWDFSSANFVGSTGNVNFDLTWSGAPYAPSINSMAGTINFKLGHGRIVNLSTATNAKVGLGRMLNVFSLQSIPRRLSLDFSDIFENGYTFNILKGDFNLKNGNALTQNTFFDGPIARVEISGRIGLVAKDFDMKMSVTPYVTSSLPVVATLATGFNPIAGIVTWVVDKVVSHQVSKVTTYNYSVTGPWDNPDWQQVKTGGVAQP